MKHAIKTIELTKRFGDTVAVDRVSLSVPRGSVFGYIGPNGAGKSTTIRMLVGLLRPSSGRAVVLGGDLSSARDWVHARVGYLPGEFIADGHLSGAQYFRYLSNLRGGVDESAWRGLADRFALDLGRPIGTLSHGNRQKVGLVQAFMHDPPVLILDEPTIGLDPLMQREFLALVNERRASGRTIFLSSHILDEVEAVADDVGIVRDGRLVAVRRVQELTASAVRRIDLVFAGDRPSVSRLAAARGVRDVRASGRTVTLTVEGSTVEVFRVVAGYDLDDIVTHEADLEDHFLTYYGGVRAAGRNGGERGVRPIRKEGRRHVREHLHQESA